MTSTVTRAPYTEGSCFHFFEILNNFATRAPHFYYTQGPANYLASTDFLTFAHAVPSVWNAPTSPSPLLTLPAANLTLTDPLDLS